MNRGLDALRRITLALSFLSIAVTAWAPPMLAHRIYSRNVRVLMKLG